MHQNVRECEAVNRLIRLVPVVFACAAAQAFAGDPPTPSPVEPAKTATPAVTADTTSPTDAAAAPPKSATPAVTADTTLATSPTPEPPKVQRLYLEDKTLTNAEVSRLLSQGYKPQKGRGDNILYCRREQQLGTHFEKKVCLTADQLKTMTQDSRDITDSLERNFGNRSRN
jgi:hypothetical protein